MSIRPEMDHEFRKIFWEGLLYALYCSYTVLSNCSLWFYSWACNQDASIFYYKVLIMFFEFIPISVTVNAIQERLCENVCRYFHIFLICLNLLYRKHFLNSSVAIWKNYKHFCLQIWLKANPIFFSSITQVLLAHLQLQQQIKCSKFLSLPHSWSSCLSTLCILHRQDKRQDISFWSHAEKLGAKSPKTPWSCWCSSQQKSKMLWVEVRMKNVQNWSTDTVTQSTFKQ